MTAVESGLVEVKSELADFRQETRAGFRTVARKLDDLQRKVEQLAEGLEE